jgi:Domain of unknown function (DUF222)/HNH endonuclease
MEPNTHSASSAVTTARALFHGPLTATAQALTAGELSPGHAAVLAHGTQELADRVAVEAEPVLVEAARRLDPPRLRRVLGHLQQLVDPEGTDPQAERRHEQRGLWLTPTFAGMVALDGLLEPEAGQTLLAALEPLARPASAEDHRSSSQRRADALAELARRALEGGRLPQTVFPDCDRPLAWCDAHHLQHWLHGGRTDLANLALVCRAHHRVVHEGGWRPTRGPDGRFNVSPPQRPPRPHQSRRRHQAAA